VDAKSPKNEEVAAAQGDNNGLVTATEGLTSPENGNGNGYALTDAIDDLMVAEFPETTAPQADSEEVVLLSPTPPSVPPPPPPLESDEPEVVLDEPEVVAEDVIGADVEDGGCATSTAGHQGNHESRVTLSGPLQFMGRNDLPRGDEVTPPLSPVSSPVKLLDVLPGPLRDAAAAEASHARSVPMTSGSIDDTQSDAGTSRVDEQQDVFSERSESVSTDVIGGEELKTDSTAQLIPQTLDDVPFVATESSNAVSVES